MKKYLLLILFLVISTQIFAYRVWSEFGYDYPKGYTFADIMKSDPKVTWSDIRLSKSIVSLNEASVDLYFDVNYSWRNFNRKKIIPNISVFRTITSFRISVWVSVEGKVTKEVNEEIIDVSSISEPAPDVLYYGEHITTSSATYSGTFTIDLTKYPNYQIVDIDYVEFHITPHTLNEEEKSNDEYGMYKETQVYKISVDQSGQKQKITRVNTDVPIINAVSHINPMYDASGTGSPRYLIYNNPNATVAVALSSTNCPVKREGRLFYTANLASIGVASTPVPSSYKVGNMYDGYCCTTSCVDGEDKHIQMVGDNKEHTKFLYSTYPNKGFCTASRSRHQVLTSIDEEVTKFEKFLQFGDDLDSLSSTLKTWIYHLRDFKEVAVNNEKLEVGTVIRIRNSGFYSYQDAFSHYPEYILMGYTPYGPPFARYLTVEKGNQYTKSYNTLDFQIVPEATMPDLPVERTIKKFVCASSKIEDINDVLLLRGNEIECKGYATTIYSPDYRWEVSVDGGEHWNTMTEKEYSRYFLSYDLLPFPTNINENTDLILRSSIFELGKELRFRQSCILKSFSSTIPSNLYTHYEDGLYYIKLTGENFYTYSCYDSLLEENLFFREGSAPEVQYICEGSEPIKNISFSFKRTSTMSNEMYNSMLDILRYEIVRLDKDFEEVVSYNPNYTMNYSGDTLHYECRIILCNDTISRDLWVLPLAKDFINLDDISSSGQIREVEKENNIVNIMVAKGKDVEITIADEKLNTTDFFIREVKEYIKPEIIELDFDSFSWQQMVDYAEANCYYTSCVNDYRQFGEGQLRSICYAIQETKNNKILEDARQKYLNANAWKLFDKENTTIFKTKSDTLTSDVFFIKKQNKTYGCFSDSVRINIHYFEGIKNNIISFAAAEDAEKDKIYIPVGSKNPTISGMLVEGGYGVPDTLSGIYTSYEYQYISRSVGGVWQKLSTPFIDYGQHVTPSKTNLAAGRTTIDRNIEIARVVYSRLNNNILTQISDTSNILKIHVEYPITEEDVKIKRENICPGTEIRVLISDDFSNSEQQNIEYFWSVSDADLILTYSDIGNRICYINGATEDFVLSVYRHNKRLDSYTDSYEVEIPISEVEAKFNILTSDGNEINIFKDTTQLIEFNSGDKVFLINNSKGADSFLWTLQLQYFLGYEVEGTQTSIKDPSCYLYNEGINKLRLTVKNSDGCSHTISAGNIYVNNININVDERKYSVFATQDGEYPDISSNQEFALVYPTLITDEVEFINIKSNEQEVSYSIYNAQGHVIAEGTDSYSFQIQLPYMPKGMYIIELNGKYIKLIRL